MNDLSSLFGGISVYKSEHATVFDSNRKHKKTRSMSQAYHNRIQKKWDKRYGKSWQPGYYLTADGKVFAHPKVFELLKREVNKRDSAHKALRQAMEAAA